MTSIVTPKSLDIGVNVKIQDLTPIAVLVQLQFPLLIVHHFPVPFSNCQDSPVCYKIGGNGKERREDKATCKQGTENVQSCIEDIKYCVVV